MTRVVVSGTGQMGTLVLHTLEAEPGIEPVGVVEPQHPEGEAAGAAGAAYPMSPDPMVLFERVKPEVVVDFTNAAFTPKLADAVLAHGVRPVIGTSGVDEGTVTRLREGLGRRKLGGVVVPNFAIGAVLLMHLTTIAARYFDSAEIIELHHDRKVDAPSGTALATARMMRSARGRDFEHNVPSTTHIAGTRGGTDGGIPIHSVRLPGFVAHQEVIFGGVGQTLVLRHDSTGRDSFMPGVVLAVREVLKREGLAVGLDELIGLR
ncbi:MAG: 4-hydroxy-tetrahydrodipicolinate reductase [Chloroflexi bacterium]|nr:4-hydroxy-tetrahydrodipicolinate reductase [Chloroflexota bacterium]